MATIRGLNNARANADPTVKVDATEDHGRIRVKKDEITFSGEVSSGDVLEMGVLLPQGAMIIEVVLQSEQLGSSDGNGAADIGWLAGESGSEVADPDGIFPNVEFSGAPPTQILSESATLPVAFVKKFVEAVQLVITFTEGTDQADGKRLVLLVHYSVD